MNTPVTHAECLRAMKELDEKIQCQLREERADFRELIHNIESWVEKLEQKIDKSNDSLDSLVKEIAIIGIAAFIAFVWGKL